MTPLPRNRWKRKSSLASEKAREMGIASQAKQRAKREAEIPERMREIPAICLGLSLSQSTPLVKAKTRGMQDHLADLESEFWKEHPEQ